MKDERPSVLTVVGAEPVAAADPARYTHLTRNRGLIVRRSLLSTAMAGLIPLPVMDEYVAGRVRAGLLMKLAESRQVDLPPASAEILSDAQEGSALRHATLTAATLVALKLTWRKFFALLAASRGAEEMATTFQMATLFDHYCAQLHVGAALDRSRASDLRAAIHTAVSRTEKARLVAVFRDGGRMLGRSLLEAPQWLSTRLATLGSRWISSRGNVDATFGAAVDEVGDSGAEADRWLDRAARAVDDRLSALGSDYLGTLVNAFESEWRTRPPAA